MLGHLGWLAVVPEDGRGRIANLRHGHQRIRPSAIRIKGHLDTELLQAEMEVVLV